MPAATDAELADPRSVADAAGATNREVRELADPRSVADAAGEALRRAVSTGDTARAVRDALRGLDDDGARRRAARRITAASVLRLRLAYLSGSDDPARWLAALDDGRADDTARDRWPADRLERLVVQRSCPRPLVDALVGSLGVDGTDRFLAAVNQPGPRTLRANALRGSRDDVAAALAAEGIRTTPGAASPWALHVEGKANLFGSRAWRAGLFEVQDEGSQLVALACDAKPDAVVVDLCAGRGGKTLALAAMMGDRGALWVDDVDERALADMRPRLSRAGVRIARRGLPPPRSADVVLVDAPCSSIGALRRWPDLRFSFAGDDAAARLAAHVPTQRALLEQGRALVRPGGRVVYATCSVLVDENERVAGVDVVDARTLLPHVHGTDGFFVAVDRAAPGR